MSSNQGWQEDIGVDMVHSAGRLDASIGPRVGMGDRRYIDANFGVTPAELATNPTLGHVYEPAAGLRYLGLVAAASWQASPRWRTTVDVSYHRLISVAGNSPIVATLGSADQVAVGMGLSYALGRIF